MLCNFGNAGKSRRNDVVGASVPIGLERCIQRILELRKNFIAESNHNVFARRGAELQPFDGSACISQVLEELKIKQYYSDKLTRPKFLLHQNRRWFLKWLLRNIS